MIETNDLNPQSICIDTDSDIISKFLYVNLVVSIEVYGNNLLN